MVSDGFDKEQLLSKSFVFDALERDTGKTLAAMSHLRQHSAGDFIFREGDAGDSMMAIAQGQVRIATLSPTAREVVLAELSQGDVFGEISVLDGQERSADAQAVTNCTLVVLERRALLEAMRSDPKLAQSLIEVLCTRIRRSDERMMEIGFMPIHARLASALLRVSDGGDAAPKKKLSLSQSDLANMIGSSRENVNRCLRKWQKEGVLDLKDGWIILPDRDALAQIAERP